MFRKFRTRAFLFGGASAVVALLIGACISTPPSTDAERTVVAPSSVSALSTGRSGMNVWSHDDPGSTKVLPRIHSDAPPRIPHGIADFHITRGENDCATCHVGGIEVADGHSATKIPQSHYSNDFTGEKREDMFVGIRHNCRQCHVPQATGDFPEGVFAPGS